MEDIVQWDHMTAEQAARATDNRARRRVLIHEAVCPRVEEAKDKTTIFLLAYICPIVVIS